MTPPAPMTQGLLPTCVAGRGLWHPAQDKMGLASSSHSKGWGGRPQGRWDRRSPCVHTVISEGQRPRVVPAWVVVVAVNCKLEHGKQVFGKEELSKILCLLTRDTAAAAFTRRVLGLTPEPLCKPARGSTQAI